MNDPRLEALLDRYIDGRLTPDKKLDLEQMLLASPEARETFWLRLRFEGVIEEAVDTQRSAQWMTDVEFATRQALTGTREPATDAPTPWKGWAREIFGLPLLTVFGAVAIAVVAFLSLRVPQRVPIPEPTSNGVAVLASAWNIRWADAQPPLADGSVLPPGRIRIASGVLGIEFYNGARVTLEGPADIELLRVDEMLCHTGKLRVQVPQVARNFRVRTDRLEVLDLGTEFGLTAGTDVATEVHVFDGKVAWTQRDLPAATAPREELIAGQAIRMNPSGLARIAARPDEFVSGDALQSRLALQQQERLRAWSAASRSIAADPHVVLHFDFAKDHVLARTLHNRAAHTGVALDGVVVGSEWTEGRWPGKGALEFKQPGDRVRVAVPGEFDALTYVAWLRVKAVERPFTSIFLTDGFEPGEPHWQFFEGNIRLGIGDAERRSSPRFVSPRVRRGPSGANYTTKDFRSESNLDRWIQLAVVMDTVRREVTHYVDGQSVCTDTMVIAQKLRIGDAELGNWGLPPTTDPQPIRNFHGTMDEFTIYAAALSAEEIRSLFDEGQPAPASWRVAQAR